MFENVLRRSRVALLCIAIAAVAGCGGQGSSNEGGHQGDAAQASGDHESRGDYRCPDANLPDMTFEEMKPGLAFSSAADEAPWRKVIDAAPRGALQEFARAVCDESFTLDGPSDPIRRGYISGKGVGDCVYYQREADGEFVGYDVTADAFLAIADPKLYVDNAVAIICPQFADKHKR